MVVNGDDSELVRRRGGWINNKVMETYVRKLLLSSFYLSFISGPCFETCSRGGIPQSDGPVWYSFAEIDPLWNPSWPISKDGITLKTGTLGASYAESHGLPWTCHHPAVVTTSSG